MQTLAMLPLKMNSTRVPNKNTIPIGPYKGGIAEIKMEQLIKCETVDCIFVSSESDKIFDIIKNTENRLNNKKPVYYNKRPLEYVGDCHTDKWIKYLSTQVEKISDIENVILVHATSPFFDEKEIDKFVKEYKKNYEKNKIDSYVTCDVIRNFLWKDGKPWNYDPETQGRFPLTQTLEPLYELNSAAHIFKFDDYIETGDKLPGLAGFYETDWMVSLDVDWPEDFKRLKILWETYRG